MPYPSKLNALPSLSSSSSSFDDASSSTEHWNTHVPERAARWIVESILSPIVWKRLQVTHSSKSYDDYDVADQALYHTLYMDLLLRNAQFSFLECPLSNTRRAAVIATNNKGNESTTATKLPEAIQKQKERIQEHIVLRLSNSILYSGENYGLSILQVQYIGTILRTIGSYYSSYPKANNDIVRTTKTNIYLGKALMIDTIQSCFYDQLYRDREIQHCHVDVHFLPYIKRCMKKEEEKRKRSLNIDTNFVEGRTTTTTPPTTTAAPTTTTTDKIALHEITIQSKAQKTTGSSTATITNESDDELDNNNVANSNNKNGEQPIQPKTSYEKSLVSKIQAKMNRQSLPYHLLTTNAGAALHNNYKSSTSTLTCRVTAEEIVSSYRKLLWNRRNIQKMNERKRLKAKFVLGYEERTLQHHPQEEEEDDATTIRKIPIEDVMNDIMTQREERDDAKRMDEARLLSERTRKNEAKQRREQIEKEYIESIARCTNIDFLLNPLDRRMFSTSWILNDTTIYQFVQDQFTKSSYNTGSIPFKMILLTLLQLEKKAMKWYGTVLPKSYFQFCVIEHIISAITLDLEGPSMGSTSATTRTIVTPTHHVRRQIQIEIDQLKVIMYNLSSQVGGVPKTFRDVHDQYVLNVSKPISSKSSTTTETTATSLSPTKVITPSPNKKQKVSENNHDTHSTGTAAEKDADVTLINLYDSDDEDITSTDSKN